VAKGDVASTERRTSVRADQVYELADYISRKVIRRPGVAIDENTPLVSSGLIDSFALIEIFLQLETITSRKIPVGKVRAKDMDTVGLMLSMAEKIGVST
jgi:hypothetical protein